MQVGALIIVKGLVQGVGYRYYIYRRAAKYSLNGYVKNLYNGDVEIYVEGERSLVEELIGEAKRGPLGAHVNDLKIEWRGIASEYSGFHVY